MKLQLFIFLLFYQLVCAQSSGEFHYVYYNKVVNYETMGILTFKENLSVYTTLKSDDVKEEKVTLTDDGNVHIQLPDSEFRESFYINLKDNTLDHLKLIDKKVVSLKEEIPEIKWNIEPEFKNFNTYTGQKATGNFRGRSYTVWFATEIPLPYGPWKLQGLPGIILEAIDDKNEIYFSVKKISLGKSMIPKMPQVEESFTLKEYISVEQPKRLEEIMQLMRSRMKDRNTIITDIDTGRESALEITYEWEKTDK